MLKICFIKSKHIYYKNIIKKLSFYIRFYCHTQPPYTSRFQLVNLFELSVLIVLTKTNAKLILKFFIIVMNYITLTSTPAPLYNGL